MPFVVAAVLPNVDWATRPTENTAQGGMEPLRPSPRGVQRGRHDAGEPDAGVLNRGGGEFFGTHLGLVRGPVVPKEGYDLSGRERVPPRRRCHRTRRLPQRGQPPVVGDVLLPLEGSCDGAHYSKLQKRRRRAVFVGTGVPARRVRTPSGRTGGVGGVLSAIPMGLRPRMAAVADVALRPGSRPGTAGRVSSAVTLGLRVPVAAGGGVALRPGGRPGAAGRVSSAVVLRLRVAMAAVADVSLRPGRRPGTAGGVSPATTLGLLVPVAAGGGVLLRPGGRPSAAGGVSPAVVLGLRVPMAAGVGVALRPGGRPGAVGGVSPVVALGFRVPAAAGVGVAFTALAAVGAPHAAVAAGSSTAATVALTGPRKRAVSPCAGSAAPSSAHTVPGVVAGASGAADGSGRPPVTEFGTALVGVVVMQFLGSATSRRRPGPVITGGRVTVPGGVARRGRRGFAAGPRAGTRGTACARLPFATSRPVAAQRMVGRPRRRESGGPNWDIGRGSGVRPRIGGPGLHRAAALHVGVPPLPGVVRGLCGRFLRCWRDIHSVGQWEAGGHRSGLLRHR